MASRRSSSSASRRLAGDLHRVRLRCLSGVSFRLESARLLAKATVADANLAAQIACVQGHRAVPEALTHVARNACQGIRCGQRADGWSADGCQARLEFPLDPDPRTERS
jgi:hypothetical protein